MGTATDRLRYRTGCTVLKINNRHMCCTVRSEAFTQGFTDTIAATGNNHHFIFHIHGLTPETKRPPSGGLN